MRKEKRLLNQHGQSTVEFALSILLMMGFVLFFVQLSFLFAYGNLVHYATFMAARSYLAAGDSPEEQTERAKSVIIQLLKRSAGMAGVEKYPFIAKGEGNGGSNVPGLITLGDGPNFDPANSSLSWMQGVRYRFKGKLTSVPLGGGKEGSANFLTLTSESWLGRERSAQECQKALSTIQGGVLYDNGC